MNGRYTLKEVKLLGIEGCPTCKKISTLIDEFINENNLNVHIETVYNMNKILEYDIVAMPGIVVDGVLKISGKIPTEKELTEILF